MCCFHCNHRVFSCVDYVATMTEEWACLVLLDRVLRHWPLGLQTKFSVCGLLVCMYICVCVCTFRFEVPLCIVISGLLCRASDIFRYLKLLRSRNACHANPERERERESIWSNSNTDAAPVDLSIFVSLPLLLWTVLRSTVSSCFFNRSSRWRMF